MDQYSNKLAVVTGAGSGIGAAISTSLVENGLEVVGLDILEENLNNVLSVLRGKKGNFHCLKVDLRNEKDIMEAFAWIEKKFDGINILVNNAGIIPPIKPISETESDHIEKVFSVNVKALTICSREAIKSMKKHNIGNGKIVNISSAVGHFSSPFPGFVLYTASKSAVLKISEGLRVELAKEKSDIKVTVICPGLVKTEIFERIGATCPDSKPKLDPKDIADAILFCLERRGNVQITQLQIQPLNEDVSHF